MRFAPYLVAVLPSLLQAAALHAKASQVESIVNSILEEFTNYTAYHGPKYVPAVTPREMDHEVKRQTISTPYWYEYIAHQGISAFGPSGYSVYRNVKDFGAKGDGVTDDTAAINAAISSGGRCGQGCASSTTTPAVVYFPAGTYLISSSIVDYYYTQLIGNANNPPTLKATAGFTGFGLIDGNVYYTSNLNWISTNVFCRQIRNFILDMTNIPAISSATGIHWPTAQATSIQNVVFQMSDAPGTQHVGLFIESGSAGFMSDLTFNGGYYGMNVGNQQYTMRALTFNNAVTAINLLWDWGWTFHGLSINNCRTGLNIASGGSGSQNVGSVTLIDSTFTNTPLGILTAYTPSSSPPAAGSLILENVQLNNVPIAIQSPSGNVLQGTVGSTTIAGWGEGHKYVPTGPTTFQGVFSPNSRPPSLLSGSSYYARSKPQYNGLPVSSFVSTRSSGARGDGVTDDTSALQAVINSAVVLGKIVYFDAGTYKVTSTLQIPPGSRLVGEAYPVIMSSGNFFNNINNPQPVVRVGAAGQAGQMEWSDMIVATQGTQAGAILIEWNLATGGTPSGMWDVHTRIGGFAGSNLQAAQCPTTPGSPTVNTACIGAYMSMHITPGASGLYMENVWLWTADHDIDSSSNTQITVYSGRGLYLESAAGTFWLYGTSVEHHALYQYQLANTKNIFMGQIQTETPYYQPNPTAPTPLPVMSSLNDPDFASSCAGQSGICADAWGVRVIDSQNVLIYGAGLYSFFNDYSLTCSNQGNGEACQNNIFSVEGASSSNVNMYNLNTVGVTNQITMNGVTYATYSSNLNGFVDTAAMWMS